MGWYTCPVSQRLPSAWGLICSILAVACGDVVANSITGGDFNQPVTTMDSGAGSGGSGGTASCPSGSLEFRGLLIIKPVAELDGVTQTLAQDEIDNATAGFRTTLGYWLDLLTSSRLCFVGEVFVSPRPLTSVSARCGTDLHSVPWIADVTDDIREQAPRGRYDDLFVYSPNADPQNAVACGDGPLSAANYAGLIYLNPRGAAAWQDQNDRVYDALLWLWTLTLRNFYRPLSGVTPPDVPDLYASDNYGYSFGLAPYGGWKAWLGDILNRQVVVSGERAGLGEPAWAHGNLRSAAPP